MKAVAERAERSRAVRQEIWTAPGEDRCGEHYFIGTGVLSCKVLTDDSQGSLAALELVQQDSGGPARHLHHHQDEWFYVVEGEYLFEVGSEQFLLRPGGSALGPRGIPHTWSFLGEGTGRILFVLTPAGRIEAFFRELGRLEAIAPQDPAFWPPYEMELVGPPLAVR
jgi:mannose-6-phosphate isomerase-like protein (cupin superfamily)